MMNVLFLPLQVCQAMVFPGFGMDLCDNINISLFVFLFCVLLLPLISVSLTCGMICCKFSYQALCVCTHSGQKTPEVLLRLGTTADTHGGYMGTPGHRLAPVHLCVSQLYQFLRSAAASNGCNYSHSLHQVPTYNSGALWYHLNYLK